MARQKRADGKGKNGNGANLGFEEKLWQAADKLRGSLDAAEYKGVVLGLIFLKYVSDGFEERRAQLEQLCDIRGIEAHLGEKWADSFVEALHKDLKTDFLLANPPFNVLDWNGAKVTYQREWLA